MPDVHAGLVEYDGRNIRHVPANGRGSRTKPQPRRSKGRRRQVQHRQVDEAEREQVVDQCRRAAANIQNGGRGRDPRRLVESEGSLGMRLKPADRIGRFRTIHLSPMLLRRHRRSLAVVYRGIVL